MKDIKVGLAGFGTVGRGTWDLLEKNKKKIENSSQIKVSVVAVADPDKSKFEGVNVHSQCHVYSDAFQLLQDKSIDIVIELIGGETIAKEFVISALREGKMVVTANKALLAKHGKQIFNEAEKNGINFMIDFGARYPFTKPRRGMEAPFTGIVLVDEDGLLLGHEHVLEPVRIEVCAQP